MDTTELVKGTAEVTDRAAAAATVAETAWAAARYADLRADESVVRARRIADAWCAAFLTPKTPATVPITTATVAQIANGSATAATMAAVDALATRHRLFHWHLEFPDVLTVPDTGPTAPPYGWTGGFHAILGNPPWERVKLQEQEFFAARAPEIAGARNAAARGRAIAALAEHDPALLAEFTAAKRFSEATSAFLRGSGRYPLCGVGDVNTYSVFAEHFRGTLGLSGRSGIITPTGLATDATTAAFFSDTVAAERLASFYDFDNEAKIFAGVHHAYRFALTSMTGGERVPDVRLAFVVRHINDVPARRFALAPSEVLLLNPNTGTLPVFRSRRDAEVTLTGYRAHPVLIRDGGANPWGLRFGTLFHMANDSGQFRTADDLRASGGAFDGWAWTRGEKWWLPLYEAKMLSHHNDRYSTYAGATQAQLNMGTLPRLTDAQLDDPDAEPLARYWVEEAAVERAVPDSWDRSWLLGWRDIARASDVRTFVPSVLPRAAVGDGFLLAFPIDPVSAPLLQAVWSSMIFDYVSRQKLSGTHMKYFVTKQLACPAPVAFDAVPAWLEAPLATFFRPRVLELTYTSQRLAPYAVDVLEGTPGETDPGPPFRWRPERRAQLRAELDAAMMHLYGLDSSDAEHVLDSFSVLRRYEERDHGEYVTKRLVLREYDAMAAAAGSGVPYRSLLDLAPGAGPRHPMQAGMLA